MDEPLVSCILATGNRQLFLEQAIRCYRRQSYPARELIVVDDDPRPWAGREALLRAGGADDRSIHYIRLDRPASLGDKLNLGISLARGPLIQKLDDDDYYHPDFLAAMVAALDGRDPDRTLAALDCFLVLLVATGELKFSGHGWCAGGTLCFHRELWERSPFRDLPRAVDWWFLEDHRPRLVTLCRPELYILVRHETGHLWNRLGDEEVTAYFRRCSNYTPGLAGCLASAEDRRFYESLRTRSPSATGERTKSS